LYFFLIFRVNGVLMNKALLTMIFRIYYCFLSIFEFTDFLYLFFGHSF
jgi:hypothetical protein